eukprot:g29443.t1
MLSSPLFLKNSLNHPMSATVSAGVCRTAPAGIRKAGMVNGVKSDKEVKPGLPLKPKSPAQQRTLSSSAEKRPGSSSKKSASKKRMSKEELTPRTAKKTAKTQREQGKEPGDMFRKLNMSDPELEARKAKKREELARIRMQEDREREEYLESLRRELELKGVCVAYKTSADALKDISPLKVALNHHQEMCEWEEEKASQEEAVIVQPNERSADIKAGLEQGKVDEHFKLEEERKTISKEEGEYTNEQGIEEEEYVKAEASITPLKEEPYILEGSPLGPHDDPTKADKAVQSNEATREETGKGGMGRGGIETEERQERRRAAQRALLQESGSESNDSSDNNLNTAIDDNNLIIKSDTITSTSTTEMESSSWRWICTNKNSVERQVQLPKSQEEIRKENDRAREVQQKRLARRIDSLERHLKAQEDKHVAMVKAMEGKHTQAVKELEEQLAAEREKASKCETDLSRLQRLFTQESQLRQLSETRASKLQSKLDRHAAKLEKHKTKSKEQGSVLEDALQCQEREKDTVEQLKAQLEESLEREANLQTTMKAREQAHTLIYDKDAKEKEKLRIELNQARANLQRAMEAQNKLTTELKVSQDELARKTRLIQHGYDTKHGAGGGVQNVKRIQAMRVAQQSSAGTAPKAKATTWFRRTAAVAPSRKKGGEQRAASTANAATAQSNANGSEKAAAKPRKILRLPSSPSSLWKSRKK